MTYFDILGIEPTLDKQQIKKAFRKKILAAHPDKQGDEELAKKILDAWNHLSDNDELQLYYEQVKQSIPAAASAPSAAPAYSAAASSSTAPQFRESTYANINKALTPFNQKLTVFIPFFVNNHVENALSMAAYGILDLGSKFSTEQIDFSQIAETIKLAFKVNNFHQVGVTLQEGCEIVNQHSWYKRNKAYYLIEAHVNLVDLHPPLAESAVSDAINARTQPYLALQQNTIIALNEIVGLHLGSSDPSYSKKGLFKNPASPHTSLVKASGENAQPLKLVEEKMMDAHLLLNTKVGSVSKEFANDLIAFLMPTSVIAFFKQTPQQRLQCLNSWRANPVFANLLKNHTKSGVVAQFLRNTLENDEALINQLRQNRLGQNYLPSNDFVFQMIKGTLFLSANLRSKEGFINFLINFFKEDMRLLLTPTSTRFAKLKCLPESAIFKLEAHNYKEEILMFIADNLSGVEKDQLSSALLRHDNNEQDACVLINNLKI